MAELKRIVDFLDTYLDILDFKDDSWNGLQFEGKTEVNKILFAVDAGIETFEKAKKGNYDMVIVHHGHFWKSSSPNITGWKKDRLKILFENDISLYGCHLPLDKNKEVGNNAELLRLIGADIKDEFAEYSGKTISWLGEFKKEKSLDEIKKILEKEISAKVIVLPFGNQKIKTVAVCTGGGTYGTFFEALFKKVDLYITGDTSELYHTAKDSEINVMFAGHHATEILGVRALSALLKRRFDAKCEFVDMPTGL